MGMLISDAMAAVSTEAPQQGGSFSLVMIAVIFVLFYFMLIRPQNKRAKEHRALIGQVKVGDEVVTLGGMLAKVVHVDDQYLKIQVTDGVEITIQRSAISAVLPKGTLKTL